MWTVEKPFADIAVFGCVAGVASLQADGRHTCISRTCSHIQSAVVGLPYAADQTDQLSDTVGTVASYQGGGGVAYFGGGRIKAAAAGGGGLRGGGSFVPQALKRRPYGQSRQLLSRSDDEYIPPMEDLTEEQKSAKTECDASRVLEKGKTCRDVDQTGCILPQLKWSEILSGEQQSLGESGEGVTHGNYKWKNMGATMWKAKQKGKDPKFWKKDKTEE